MSREQLLLTQEMTIGRFCRILVVNVFCVMMMIIYCDIDLVFSDL